jgi:DNA modification methylase
MESTSITEKCIIPILIPNYIIMDKQPERNKKLSPFTKLLRGDARILDKIPSRSIDLIVTSPPYWLKRDYGVEGQIGLEETPAAYVKSLIDAMKEWRRVLKRTGSIILNIGDTYVDRCLANIPGRLELAAQDEGWIIRNRIIWAKDKGMPEPAKNRLANRHEYIIHFTLSQDYYYDLFGYSVRFGNGANPGDIWSFKPSRILAPHLAPFPDELVERSILLACPKEVCSKCGKPRSRIIERTTELDPSRPQAKRAMEIAKKANLTPAHIAAIQATGISDAGKALRVQNGTGRNSASVKLLAAEAKKVLGGYFREFTFAKRKTVGWSTCNCKSSFKPGVVLDPFCGTGTTLRVAAELNRSAIGVDLSPSEDLSR